MNTKLYHREIGFPSWVRIPVGDVTLRYSNHARRASFNDRYGWIHLPESIAVTSENLIEIEVDDGRVVKIVVRTSYDSQNDLIVVVIPGGFVKAVWLNRVNDKHKTLRRDKYCSPV